MASDFPNLTVGYTTQGANVVTFDENTINAAPRPLLANSSFSDDDFGAGSLRISGLLTTDRLTLGTDSTVSVAGNLVAVGGDLVGTVWGGSGTDFKIRFFANAKGSQVETLLQHIQYQNTSDNPTASHNLTIALFDGAGVLASKYLAPATDSPLDSIKPSTLYDYDPLGTNATSGTSAPAFVDLNGDGRPDLVMGSERGNLRSFFQYTDASGHTAFREVTGTSEDLFAGIDASGTASGGGLTAGFSKPAFGDVNGDGRADLVLGSYSGTLRTFLRGADGRFVEQIGSRNPFNGIDLGDVNGDGQADLVVGSYDINGVRVYLHDASGAPHFIESPGLVGGSNRSDGQGRYGDTLDESPTFADITGDGVADLIVNIPGYSAISAAARNSDGKFFLPEKGTPFSGSYYPSEGIAFADLNGDGQLELVTGRDDGTLTTYAYEPRSLTVNITAQNDPPSLSGVSPGLKVREEVSNAGPQRIDTDVAFSDPDFKGGTLTVAGLVAGDRVALATDGTFSLSGNLVCLADGLVIGTIAGGSGTTFTITLNASATASTVEALIEHLTYQTVSNAPAASRTLTISVQDDAGATTASTDGTVVVSVIPYDNAPSFGGDGRLAVLTGASVKVTTADLTAIDPDTDAARLTYTLGTATNGSLLYDGNKVTHFSQEDLAGGHISFRQDGSDNASAGFTVSLSDGTTTIGPRSVAVAVDPVPRLVNGTTQPGSGSLKAGDTATITVGFSEAVTVIGQPLLLLSDGGIAKYVSGAGSNSLVFSHLVQAGQSARDLTIVGLDVSAGSIRDAAGQNVMALPSMGIDPAGVLSVDGVAPSAIGIAPSSTDAVRGGTLVETVTFSEKVSGVDASDFTVVAAGTAGAHIASVVPVSSDGTTYTVTLDQLTGNGQIRLDLNGRDTGITDAAGNAVAAGYTSGGTTALSDHTPCYCTGTLILTARGEVPVEALSVGDLAVTASGEHRPIRWIGHRRTQIARHPQPERVRPIRILAGAIAPGLPTRDLRVSPGHAVAIDGVLVKAGRLVNGVSIVRESVPSVTYWHIEVDTHDLLVANGMPAESYIETGNRHAFDNAGALVQAHPDFEAKGDYAARTCLPLVEGGDRLKAIRAKLFARTPERFTTEAQVMLLADGDALAPVSTDGRHHRFAVPEGVRSLRPVSRSGIASEVQGESGDHRRFGVMVRGLHIDGMAISFDALGEGWNAQAPGRDHRWTDGDAAMPVGRAMAFQIATLERYPIEVELAEGKAA